MHAGGVLAVLDPNLLSVERSTQWGEMYRLESEIAQLERQLARWQQVGDTVPRKDVENARLDLARLHKARDQISGTVLGCELLTVPVEGQTGDVHIVPGEVVGPQDTLIELVDPARVRVEVVLYDLTLADRIRAGSSLSLGPDWCGGRRCGGPGCGPAQGHAVMRGNHVPRGPCSFWSMVF
ncbi:MAG: membrane-fusion protein [Rhodospirillaceae bacterium]|nr:MAG: membrane-fusion protein [Rhodospirillaceae bacterium]